MSFEEKGLDSAPVLPPTLRKIDIILLTDNRKPSKADRLPFDYRSSAFKQTEIDPLEERMSEGCPNNNQSLQNLAIRVTKLEKRVRELEDLKGCMSSEAGAKGRKRRRRFEEMQRNIQCEKCRKSYGSETALKYHCKLKHADESSSPQ